MVSCVLQPQNQTKVNINFSLPAGAAAERTDAEGSEAELKPRGGGQSPQTFSPPPPSRGPRPGRARGLCAALPAGRRVSPLLHPSSALTEQVPRGRQPAPHRPAGPGVGQPLRGPGAPASPAAPGSVAAGGGPGSRARRGGRRSGSLRPGLLLSFGALVCFLKGCNRASIFPPALSETAAEIPHLRGTRVCTQPKPAQLYTPEMLLHH